MRRLGMCAIGATFIVAMAAGLSGCGGGDGDAAAPPAPSPSGSATLGADGGKVVSAAAEVLVPPGAMSEPATIRIAADSTGAPALPNWVRPAGEMLAITPHGSKFAKPVTVRLRAPDVTLADNERLMIAKVQPGGEWEVFLDTVLKDGQLEIKVNSFSTFVAVRVPFTRTTLTTWEPFAFGPATLLCGGQPCANPELVRDTTVTIRLSGNGGQLPADCANPQIGIGIGDFGFMPIGTEVPVTPSMVLERNFQMTSIPPWTTRQLPIFSLMRCTDPATNVTSTLGSTVGVLNLVAGGAQGDVVAVVQFPAALTYAPGDSPTLRAILTGGPSFLLPSGAYGAPTWDDHVTVHLQRLAPGAGAWVQIAAVLQIYANPSPTGATPWRYWSVDLPMGVLTNADNGASYSILACYTRRNRLEICEFGPIAGLTMVQQSAPPSFAAQPRSILIQPGQTASFSAQVAGTPAPTLQWQTRASGSTGNWTDVPANGNAANYTTPPISLADNGTQYRLLATNSAGSLASDIATVSVNATMVPPAM